MLFKENQTTKLVYLYLKPHDEVDVSVRQLEVLLGISHRPVAEAMKRLVALELLKVLEQPGNRPRRYRVKRNGKETLKSRRQGRGGST